MTAGPWQINVTLLVAGDTVEDALTVVERAVNEHNCAVLGGEVVVVEPVPPVPAND